MPFYSAPPCYDGDIQIVGGSSANEGRIEICHSRTWSTVCDIGWDNTDAAVACRQAGYTGDGEHAEYVISTRYMWCQLTIINK